MKAVYYQRVLLSPEELEWDSACGPGLWVEAYRHKDDGELQDRLMSAFVNGSAQADCIYVDPRGEPVLKWFAGMLADMPMSRVADLVRNAEYVIPGSVENAPQLSSYESSTSGIIDLLSQSERALDFEEIGYHLNPNGRQASKVANIKFGENCSKFAALLGLVAIPKRKCVLLTSLGRNLIKFPGREKLYPRLFFRLPLFRDFVWAADVEKKERFCQCLEQMSVSTKARRASAFNIMWKEFAKAGGKVSDESVAQDLLWKMRH